MTVIFFYYDGLDPARQQIGMKMCSEKGGS